MNELIGPVDMSNILSEELAFLLISVETAETAGMVGHAALLFENGVLNPSMSPENREEQARILRETERRMKEGVTMLFAGLMKNRE